MLSLIAALSLAASDVSAPSTVVVTEGKSCLPVSHIRSTAVISDREILFEMRDRSVWRNTFAANCPRLGWEQRFSYRISGTSLCQLDTIRVLYQGGFGLDEGASCSLTRFQRETGSMREVKKARKALAEAEKAALQN
jgi:hypothetical protein